MPTPYTTIPAPFLRLKEVEFDDESAFSTPVKSYTVNHGAATVTFGGQTLPLSERAALAEAIERCFWDDLSGPVDPAGYTCNGGAFAVVPVVTGGDTLESLNVGAHNYSLGMASSLAATLRADTGTAPYSA